MGKIIGIYKITSPTGKIYIGQSNNIEYRISVYKMVKHSKSQTRIYRSLVKYGSENHTFEVVEECDEHDLNAKERYWQDAFNVCGINGLNCRLTSTNEKSGSLSEETRKKISESQKGKIIPQWQIEIIRKAQTGRIKSEETKAKFRASLKGRKYSKEYCENVSRSIKAAKHGKNVIQYTMHGEFVKEYYNACDAERQNNFNGSGNIYRAASGQRKSAHGFIWKYKEPN